MAKLLEIIKIKSILKPVITAILILQFSGLAISAPINSSLINEPREKLIKKYEHLLKGLNTANNPDYSTQKTIINTIINILKQNPKKFLSEIKHIRIKNQDDYLNLFNKVALAKLAYIETNNKIKDIRKKLNTLEKDINSLNNPSSYLTTCKLQYALYLISLKKLKAQKNYLEKQLPVWKDVLFKEFLKTKFNKNVLELRIKRYTERYNETDNEKERLNILKDRLTLLNSTKSLAQLRQAIKELEDERDKIILNLIDNYIMLELYNLKHSKNTVKIQNLVENWTSKLVLKKHLLLAKQKQALAFYIIKKKLGAFRAFLKQLESHGVHILSNIWKLTTKPILTIGEAHISIFSIFLALIIFISGVYSGKIFRLKIKESRISKNIPVSTRTIISNIGYYTIVLVTFLISLRIIGINLSSLTVILGALSVGIGFGLQNMVANFISGIILMLENSIRIGDYIEISEELKGVVKDIQMRQTTIITNDHIEVIIPNQTLFQSNVVNWTLTEKVRRFRIPFSVAYGTDIKLVEKVVLNALEKSNLNYIRKDPERYPEVKMISMNSSSVDFNLDVWVKGEDVIFPRRTQSRFLIMIYNALYESNITIPFPQLDLHVKEPVEIVKKQ